MAQQVKNLPAMQRYRRCGFDPDPGIETSSPALQADSGFFTAAPLGESYQDANVINIRREPCASLSKQPQM